MTEELLENACNFLRAGGRPSLSDWAELTPEERGAFVTAARVVEAERASRRVAELSGPEAVALANADIDGGEAHARLACEQMAEIIARRMEGR